MEMLKYQMYNTSSAILSVCVLKCVKSIKVYD